MGSRRPLSVRGSLQSHAPSADPIIARHVRFIACLRGQAAVISALVEA